MDERTTWISFYEAIIKKKKNENLAKLPTFHQSKNCQVWRTRLCALIFLLIGLAFQSPVLPCSRALLRKGQSSARGSRLLSTVVMFGFCECMRTLCVLHYIQYTTSFLDGFHIVCLCVFYVLHVCLFMFYLAIWGPFCECLLVSLK